MRYPHLFAGILIAGLLVTMLMGCGSGSDQISRTEAIDIAKAFVLDEGVMTLDDRDEVADDEGTVWHVYFPYTAASDMLGGEPHVKVAKTDGAITEAYYTQ